MDPMVKGVENPLDWTELSDCLGVNPELVKQVKGEGNGVHLEG